MKSCPNCNRTYADDTLTFCLDDGALLSAPYDPHATLLIPAERHTAPARTEILPQAPSSVDTQPARLDTLPQTSETLVYGAQARLGQPTEKPGGKHWLILGGVVVFAVVGLVIVLGYVAWQVNDKTMPEPSKNSSTAPANSNLASNTNRDASEAKALDDDSLKWLDGVWEGKGYQSNPKSTWTIKLRAQNDTYVIEYPSLSCRGKWNLIEKETGKARFKEIITDGLNRCENNGLVVIEKIDDAQVSFKYSSPNTTSVTSTAVLRKSAQSTEQR